MSEPHPKPKPKPSAHVGWRLLALLYDFFPVFGLWFLVAALFVASSIGS